MWIHKLILDLSRLKLFLSGVSVDATDSEGNTALHLAAANDRPSAIGTLVKGGASVDAANQVGWTPLMQAARHGHSAAVAALLQARADVTCRSVLG